MGTCTYWTDASHAKMDRIYYNNWLLEFADDGRCRSFTEYYMAPRKSWLRSNCKDYPAAGVFARQADCRIPRRVAFRCVGARGAFRGIPPRVAFR